MPKDCLLKLHPWLNDFALFTSYEEEKLRRSTAALRGWLKTYTVKQAGQKSTLLSMPTEKIVFVGSDKKDSIDVQVTQVINVPLGSFFDSLRKIEGTPLRYCPLFGQKRAIYN